MNIRRNRTKNNQNAWRKGKLQIPGNINGHHQISRDERKNKKGVLHMKNFSIPNSEAEISPKNKNLGSAPCKILRTILEINKGRRSEPEDKKVDGDAQGLISER